jgi:CBS domain containing-hemolysin-like protein
MEDVLEELFGEIDDEYDEQEFVEKKLSENGTMPLLSPIAISKRHL